MIGGLAWLLLASTPPQYRDCYFHVSEEDAEAQVAGVICPLSLSESELRFKARLVCRIWAMAAASKSWWEGCVALSGGT